MKEKGENGIINFHTILGSVIHRKKVNIFLLSTYDYDFLDSLYLRMKNLYKSNKEHD